MSAPRAARAAKPEPRHTGTVPVPRSVYERYAEPYALRVHGDCLAPVIRDGDTVIAAPDAPWEPGWPAPRKLVQIE